jgi:glutathione synthase/RimK-type ligase-like ATP-grasp enzyme
MILVCGIPSETMLRAVTAKLEEMEAPFVVFNQREFADSAIWYDVVGGRVGGEFSIAGRIYDLSTITAVYSRLMDDRSLPEVANAPSDSPLRAYCRSLHDTLIRWIEISPALVINRSAAMASNSSKPYQCQLIASHGFRIADTLVTNEPALVRSFWNEHKRIIYKSASGLRSIVQEMTREDDARLDRIRWCPTQFQAFVEGTNIRVHTIGTQVFATAIQSNAIDYRYSTQQSGVPAGLQAITLSKDLTERCLKLSRSLGLEFAGIDLKIAPDNQVYCFEVNPCPAYSYYESNTGQPISTAVAQHLALATRPMHLVQGPYKDD